MLHIVVADAKEAPCHITKPLIHGSRLLSVYARSWISLERMSASINLWRDDVAPEASVHPRDS